ncbi:MAG: TIGR03546 family protein [Candidatus Omnitrophica bacterium]|nr:TIGR03546 family protein [Candidatus Omnitrophota bacterium]MDD5487854.1 TIGR03546 family protein [Candidatus Omnitrophota bacterium]
MIPIISLPSRIIKLLEANVAPSEVAAGICLGLFMGFTPLNGPMAILLFICFLVFKVNRLSAMLSLPFFKLLYVLGLSGLADMVGGLLLIDIQPLTFFWKVVTGLPVIAYLGLNNTLITGGLVVSAILAVPLYFASVKGVVVIREKYADKIKGSKIAAFMKKIPLIGKISSLIAKMKGGAA